MLVLATYALRALLSVTMIYTDQSFLNLTRFVESASNICNI
jgi:hypothetical protein